MRSTAKIGCATIAARAWASGLDCAGLGRSMLRPYSQVQLANCSLAGLKTAATSLLGAVPNCGDGDALALELVQDNVRRATDD
jgi:hypothetical protein